MKAKASKTSEKTTRKGAGAKGSRAKPAASDTSPKWPGGGKKGEDEKR